MILLLATAFADSPLTSTDLSVGFQDAEVVQRARSAGSSLPPSAIDALLGDHPLGVRLAVVDALGWEGKGRAIQLAEAIAERRGKGPRALQLKDVLPAERVVLAYLLAHDDYFEMGPMVTGASDDLYGASALALASSGANSQPDDFAAQAVVALIDAQGRMDGSWCAVWTTWRSLLERFPTSKRNLPPKSVDNVTAYLKLYEDDCGTTADAALSEELDQVYDLVRYRDSVVAATQGGMTVWRNGRLAAHYDEKICSSVVVVDDVAYAGCYHRLLRFDGESWSSMAFDGEVREGGSWSVYAAPDGLRAVHGKRELALRDGKLVATGSSRDAFDVLYAADGTVWSVDFLSAVTRGEDRFPIRSSTYPGSNPRGLLQAPDGTVWAVDFDSGFLQFDQDGRRFTQDSAGPRTKGSDLAFAPDGTRWMLHYTAGPTVVRDGAVHRLDLSHQEYMRAILVDEDGTTYVAGWHGITRVERTSSGGFQTATWAVRPR